MMWRYSGFTGQQQSDWNRLGWRHWGQVSSTGAAIMLSIQ
jgi:hypothetical protein